MEQHTLDSGSGGVTLPEPNASDSPDHGGFARAIRLLEFDQIRRRLASYARTVMGEEASLALVPKQGPLGHRDRPSGDYGSQAVRRERRCAGVRPAYRLPGPGSASIAGWTASGRGTSFHPGATWGRSFRPVTPDGPGRISPAVRFRRKHTRLNRHRRRGSLRDQSSGRGAGRRQPSPSVNSGKTPGRCISG